MTRRVVNGAFDGTYVLRVSRPGFDVLNTGLTRNQLAFDSRWSETGLELMSGTLAVPDYNQEHTIPYGITFPDPPMVVATVSAPGGYITTITSHSMPRIVAGVSSLSLTVGYLGVPFDNPNLTAHYTIYRNIYG